MMQIFFIHFDVNIFKLSNMICLRDLKPENRLFFKLSLHILLVKCMAKRMGCVLGPVMSQATQAVQDLIGYLYFIFCHKTGKKYFIFKLSFLLHRVTNQNFKKSAKLLITNAAKIEEKSLKGCVSEEKFKLR